jgi:hypothetical protein
MNQRTISFAALAGGAASWWLVSYLTHRREAWDSELYFAAVLPVTALVAAAIAFFVPQRPWRWAMLPFAGQALAAFLDNPLANLMPLGLLVFAFFGALCLIPAYVGAAFGRMLRKS